MRAFGVQLRGQSGEPLLQRIMRKTKRDRIGVAYQLRLWSRKLRAVAVRLRRCYFDRPPKRRDLGAAACESS